VTGLIKWEFECTLFAFQDELVDRLLSIKEKIIKKKGLKQNLAINTQVTRCQNYPLYFSAH
jgi:hypothetical protein